MDVIILAAGKGTRMNVGYNKMFLKLGGKEIIWHTLNRFCSCSFVNKIILVTGAEDLNKCREICSGFDKEIVVTEGGKTRQESSLKGISVSDSDYVMIHDGARPFITEEDILKTRDAAFEYGAAAVGTRCIDTLKTCDENGFISGTVDRDKVFKIYTPQAFDKKMLLEFHEKAVSECIDVTDDSALCEYCGKKVKFVEGSPLNVKITTGDDILLGETLLKIYN